MALIGQCIWSLLQSIANPVHEEILPREISKSVTFTNSSTLFLSYTRAFVEENLPCSKVTIKKLLIQIRGLLYARIIDLQLIITNILHKLIQL